MDKIPELLWAFANSPAGITLIAGIVLWILNRIYAAKPLWKAYEGTIISAVRMAEQLVPEGTAGSGTEKLHTAVNFVLKVFEEVNSRPATPAEQAALTEGIQIKHDELDRAGVLDKPDPLAALAAEQKFLKTGAPQ